MADPKNPNPTTTDTTLREESVESVVNLPVVRERDTT